MQLFHWKLEGFDILIMSESLDQARKQLLTDFLHAEWQNPKRMRLVIEGLNQPPMYTAEADHTITIDSRTY
jgi:hypothetical protein